MEAVEEYLKPYHRAYKDPSDRSSYSQYREGYSDAMDIAGQVIEQAQKDAYNQAIDDVLDPYKTDHHYDENTGWCVKKKSILKLKK